MKAFIVAGVLLGVVLLGVFVLFFYRIGKPVAAEKSDSYYYHAWKNKIVYSPMGNWFELGYLETEADPATFEVLAREYGRDKNAVYWQGRRQTADRATFVVDADWIPKDAYQVYYDPKKYDGQLAIVPDADPSSYQRYRPGPPAEKEIPIWSVDKNNFYLNHQRVNVDRSTFRVLNITLACDTNFLYTVLRPANGGVEFTSYPRPSGRLRVLNEVYLQVGNTIVHSSWQEHFATAEFEAVRSLGWLDQMNVVVNENQLLHYGKLVNNIEISTVTLLDRNFLKDQHHVFYHHEEIPEADPATFEIVFEDYSRDAHRVFFKNQKLEGASAQSFTYKFNTGLATDGTRFYKDGQRVSPPTQY